MADRPAPDPAPGADAPTAAAVAAFEGAALRYAEVERDGAALRLRRLGTCDFDVAADEALLGSAAPAHLDTVAAALREVFRASDARTLVVVAHPPALVSFFAPLPEALPAPARYEQLRQEAALLADVTTAQPVRIRAVPVRTEAFPGAPGAGGGPHRWHHVVHVPESVHARLTLLARAVGATTYDLVDATQAAAAVVRGLLWQEPARVPVAPFALAVGAYATHAEFALCRTDPADGRAAWYHALHAPGGAPEDAAYFALALLERLGVAPEAVGRLFVYGDADPERHAVLGALLGRDPEPLDPLPLFGRSPEGVAPADLAAFAPCLGAALR